MKNQKNCKVRLLRVFLLLFMNCCTWSLTAQVKVGENPTTPNSSAVFEAEIITKGLLIPRMTSASRMTIASASGVSWYVSDGVSWRLYSGKP